MADLVLAVFADVTPRCPRCDQPIHRGRRVAGEKWQGWTAFVCDRRPPLRGRMRAAADNVCGQPLLVWRDQGVTYVLQLDRTTAGQLDEQLPLSANLARIGLGAAVLRVIGEAA